MAHARFLIALLCLAPAFVLSDDPGIPAEYVDSDGVLTPLFTFDTNEPLSISFTVLNDPVMGGESTSIASAEPSYLHWNGTVVDVPSLAAPGFCLLRTFPVGNFLSTFADASDATHLKLLVRSSTPEYQGFKVSFASLFTFRPLFKAYKADFIVETGYEPRDGDDDEEGWQWIKIPLSNFTNQWSKFNGEPTQTCTSDDDSVCPQTLDLRFLHEISFWAEGVSGPFHLDIRGVYAWTETFPQDIIEDPSVCMAEPQDNLRYNISSFLADETLPFDDFPAQESLAEAVCCDAFYAGFAEPKFFFQRNDVALWDALDVHNATGTTVTFYDSVCGIPLFVAPQGRSMDDFVSDTEEHGWPSFRKEEIVQGNVYISKGGRIVVSKCGTRLGTYEPDEKGPRYCLDLACIAGNPTKDTDDNSVVDPKLAKSVPGHVRGFVKSLKLLRFTSHRPTYDIMSAIFKS